MSQDIYVLVEHLQGQVADISYVMLAAARVLAGGTGGEVVAVLLGQDAQALAANLSANCVLYIQHPALSDYSPEPYQSVLAGLIRQNTPRAVLFGNTSIGAELACGLSAQLDLPLVSQCQWVRVENGALTFVSQICGGKIMAEGELPGPTTLVTMVPGGYKPEQGQSSASPLVTPLPAPEFENLHVKLKQVLQPETGDVDISTQPILVAVGRGIQNPDNLELAEELAAALGGAVCGSRPVVDQGWLPTSRLVGKSGKTVKPRLYLALGISGAPEHVEAIGNCELIVAINTDPAAPIFGLAKYGATVDLLDLAPVLAEQVRQAKGL